MARQALALAALLSLVACSPPWRPVTQANPNPLSGQTSFAYEPLTWAPDYRVGAKSEAEWLSGKDEDAARKHAIDKDTVVSRYNEAFLSHAGGRFQLTAGGKGPFRIVPTVLEMEPGYYAVMAQGAGKIKLGLKVLDEKGAVVDDVLVYEAADGFSVGDRLRGCATRLGRDTIGYLRERTGK